MQEHQGLADSVLFVVHLNVVDLNGTPTSGCLFKGIGRYHECASQMRDKVNSGFTSRSIASRHRKAHDLVSSVTSTLRLLRWCFMENDQLPVLPVPDDGDRTLRVTEEAEQVHICHGRLVTL